MIDGLGAESAPTGLTVMHGRHEGMRLPMIDIDHLPDQKPGAEHHFGPVAERIREACAILDQTWIESDAEIRSIKNQQPELIDDIDALTSQIIGVPSNRKNRKFLATVLGAERMQQSIYVLALIVRHGVREHVVSGKQTEEIPLPGYPEFLKYIDEWQPEKDYTIPQAAWDIADDNEEAYSKVYGREISLVESLKDFLVEKYGIIYTLAPELIGIASTTIESGIDQAAAFTEWLEQVHEEQDGDFRAYLQMLAADLLDKDDRPSVLSQALDTLKQRAENSLHRDFMEALLRDDVGEHKPIKEWMHLLSAALQLNTRDSADTMKTMLDLCYLWPDELKDIYKVYAAGRVDELSQRIRDVLQTHLHKQRSHPTREKFDRALVVIAPRNNQRPESSKRNGRKKATKGGRATPSLKSALPTSSSEDEAQVVLGLGMLKNTPNGHCVQDDPDAKDITAMIVKYCAGDPDDGLSDALTALVEQVRNDPYGTGTKKLTGKIVSVGGRVYPLREAMLRRNTSVSSAGKKAGRTRIIFSLINGNGEAGRTLAIREILHHDEATEKYA